jgi:hypothetical protein
MSNDAIDPYETFNRVDRRAKGFTLG